MACVDNSFHVEMPNTDTPSLKCLQTELRYAKGKCEELEKENMSLRRQISDLMKALSHANHKLSSENINGTIEVDSQRLFSATPPGSKEEETLSAVVNSAEEFVYDDGLGVYINRQNGLMFDGTVYFYFDNASGQHKYYNNETQCYEKLSCDKKSPLVNGVNNSTRTMPIVADNVNRKCPDNAAEEQVEDGEISDSDDETTSVIPSSTPRNESSKLSYSAVFRDAQHELKKDLARPNMRLIVVETPLPAGGRSVEKLYSTCHSGMIFFIPADTLHRVIGRLPSSGSPSTTNAVDIPLDTDDLVLPEHAVISFDEKLWKFILTDKHSSTDMPIRTSCIPRACTTNLSTSLEDEADADFDDDADDDDLQYVIAHADTICIGHSKLLVHVHFGHEDCDECQPANALIKYAATSPLKTGLSAQKLAFSSAFVPSMTDIKRKYGLRRKHVAAAGLAGVANESKFTDRAHLRLTANKDDDSRCVAASAPSSLSAPISADNKGCAMMLKMGWKMGDSLGSLPNDTVTDCDHQLSKQSRRARLLEPLPVVVRPLETAGLGFTSGMNLSCPGSASINVEKSKRNAKVRLRYAQLEDRKPSQATEETKPGVANVRRSNVGVVLATSSVLSRPPKLSWVKGGVVAGGVL